MARRRRNVKNLLKTCKSWDDFVALCDKQATGKEKGDLFELLTKCVLLTAPQYRSQLANVWLLNEVPSAVAKKLNLPRTDEGIDLIAETSGKEFWAIQSKYRSPADRALNRGDLSTFTDLAFQHCNNFSYGLVAHTTSKPIQKIHMMGNVAELGPSYWASMDAEAWRAVRDLLSDKSIKLEKRTPRPHQKAAISAASRHFKTDDRGKLIMPCASGKSLTAFWIAQSLGAKSIVVAVPSLALIKQSITDWTREYLAAGIKPDWLAVCSDDSVGDVSGDEFVSSVYELGIDATTDEDKIRRFLSKGAKNPKIIFTSYQSGPVLSRAALKSSRRLDLLVLDEAHKTVGDKEKRFSTLLSDKNLPVKKRLFMTATERVLSGSGRNERVYSMDDESVYGRVFHQLTFKQAVQKKIISDYKILTISVTQTEIDELIEENALLKDVSEKEHEHEAAALAAGVALNRTFENYGVSHAISFHRSIKAAKEFAEQQQMLGRRGVIADDIENDFISSKKSTAERETLMKDFVAAERALMANARCLTEGVDVPAIDCVCFASPKQSVVDIVQAAGRAMRPHKGKEFGYILLPLVVPEGMDLEEFAETTAFKTVTKTIAALSSQDERIVEYFRLLEKGKQKGGIVEIDGRVPLGLKMDLSQFAEAIETKIWDRVAKVNWRPFPDARRFTRKLKLKNHEEWEEYARSDACPPDIPATPWNVYAESGWVSMGDWLDSRNRKGEWRDFFEARDFIRSLKFKQGEEFRAFCASDDKPHDIPTNPNVVYREHWMGMGDWLGTDVVASYLREYRSFKEARNFVRKLGFEKSDQWNDYCRSGSKPNDIPAAPWNVYKDAGWKNIADWLGNQKRSRKDPWRPFPQAREFARGLKLNGLTEWRGYCKSGLRPPDIPTNPWKTYEASGWESMGDWLGTGRVANTRREYVPYKTFEAFIQKSGIESQSDWRRYKQDNELPEDIPSTPDRAYKGKGWVSWGVLTGSGRRRDDWRPYADARKFVRTLGLKNREEWIRYRKSKRAPGDIPVHPWKTYKEQGWIDIYDWLGTEHQRPEPFLPFKKARAFVRKLNLQTTTQWKDYSASGQRPKNIPGNPYKIYENTGWVSMADWLGHGREKVPFLPFHEARAIARKYGFRSSVAFQAAHKAGKLPAGIPSNPDKIYRDQGWLGASDWVGNGREKPDWRPFPKAREFARSLKLPTWTAWEQYCKSGQKPNDIPVKPWNTYKDKGWVDISDWLGNEDLPASALNGFRGFEEARSYSRSLGFTSSYEWKAFCKSGKRPKDIPSRPDKTYENEGWAGMPDWLGYDA